MAHKDVKLKGVDLTQEKNQNLTLWKASPSKWLLLPSVLLTSIFGTLFAISVASSKGIVIPYVTEGSPLFSLQVMLYNTPMLGYIAGACTAFGFIQILWRYIQILFENYRLTPRSIHFETGVLSRELDETQLFRIVDISIKKPLLLRLLGRGHLVIYSNDPSLESSGIIPSVQTPDGRKGVYLAAVKDPVALKEDITMLLEAERERRKAFSTEFL